MSRWGPPQGASVGAVGDGGGGWSGAFRFASVTFALLREKLIGSVAKERYCSVQPC